MNVEECVCRVVHANFMGESVVCCVGARKNCVCDVVIVLRDRALFVVSITLDTEGFVKRCLWVLCVCVGGVAEEVVRQRADVFHCWGQCEVPPMRGPQTA